MKPAEGEWIWTCPRCRSQGRGTSVDDALKRRNRHLRIVHNDKSVEVED